MQSSDRVLARRYAQAFFEALPAGTLDQARKELIEAHRELSPRMNEFKHPLLGAAKHKSILKQIIGSKIAPKTLRFLEVLVEKKRFPLLSAIVGDFSRLCDESRGLLRAHVRAAAALSKAEEETLIKKLEGFTGKDVALEIKLTPEIMGGMIVRIGDWVLDGSLQGQLRRMKEQMHGN